MNQVWGVQIFTRQSCRRFDLVETWRTKAFSILCYDSAHTTYLKTICVLLDAAKTWVVARWSQAWSRNSGLPPLSSLTPSLSPADNDSLICCDLQIRNRSPIGHLAPAPSSHWLRALSVYLIQLQGFSQNCKPLQISCTAALEQSSWWFGYLRQD